MKDLVVNTKLKKASKKLNTGIFSCQILNQPQFLYLLPWGAHFLGQQVPAGSFHPYKVFCPNEPVRAPLPSGPDFHIGPYSAPKKPVDQFCSLCPKTFLETLGDGNQGSTPISPKVSFRFSCNIC